MTQTSTIYLRELEKVVRKLLLRKQASTKIMELVPHQPDLTLGDDSVISTLYDSVGDSAIITGETDDIPFVEVFSQQDKYENIIHAVGYRYNEVELARSQKARANGSMFFDIDSKKIQAAMNILRTKFHIFGMYGANKNSVLGFLNNPNVGFLDSTFDPYDAGTTAEDIYQFVVSTVYSKVEQDTLLVERPNVLLMTQKFMDRAQILLFSGTAVSAFDKIRETLMQRGLMMIDQMNELTPAFLERYGIRADQTKERMMVYNLPTPSEGDQGPLWRKFSPVRSTRVRQNLLKYEGIMYQTMSSVVYDYPLSALYVDYVA